MFYKRLILIAFCAATLWPATLNAQISQTTSFTLSVTIPERAQLPSTTPSTLKEIPVSDNPLHAQIQTEIRDNVLVYLASYVVD